MTRRNQKEISGKLAAGSANPFFIPKKVSSEAKVDAIASRDATHISDGNASGSNASLQGPDDIPVPGEEQLASSPESEMAKELAKIAELLAKLQETATEQDKKWSAQDKKLDEIKRSTSVVEARLTEFAGRLDGVEGRLESLEFFQRGIEEVPLAAKVELDNLREKIDDMENRERRLNLKFIGFTEQIEGRDARVFITEAIQVMWPDIEFPRGLEIERAHRLGALRLPVVGQPAPKPRPIIAKFLRYQDKESIMEAARKEKGKWDDKDIMVYPDYSKIVNDKRALFNTCKKLLHQRKKKFSLFYPATLVIYGDNEDRRSFDDHKKALSYINSLG